MSYQPIHVDTAGRATLVLPAADEITIRPLAAEGGGFVMDLHGLTAYPSYLWLAALRARIDRALAELDETDRKDS